MSRSKSPAPRKLRRQHSRTSRRENVVAVQQEVVFRGPLPSPDMLRKYNDAHPEAAAIILRVFQEQGEHRRKLEAAVVGKGIMRADRGQVFGFVIAMTALVGGVLLLLFNKSIEGYSTIGTGFTALVAAFTIGRISQARERRRQQ